MQFQVKSFVLPLQKPLSLKRRVSCSGSPPRERFRCQATRTTFRGLTEFAPPPLTSKGVLQSLRLGSLIGNVLVQRKLGRYMGWLCTKGWCSWKNASQEYSLTEVTQDYLREVGGAHGVVPQDLLGLVRTDRPPLIKSGPGGRRSQDGNGQPPEPKPSEGKLTSEVI